jgi:hypothetical protein
MVDAMDISTPLEQRLAQLATKADLEILGESLLERLRTELVRQLQAITVSTQISAMNAKRAELPARVSDLETAVLAPPGRAWEIPTKVNFENHQSGCLSETRTCLAGIRTAET